MARLIDIYYNTVKNVLQNAEGEPLGVEQYPRINFQEEVLLNVRLVVDEANTALATDLTPLLYYTASLSNDFSDATAPVVRAINSDINVAGEFDGGNADPAEGEFSINFDGNTDEYNDALGNNEELGDAQLEIRARTAIGGPLVFVMRMPFRVLNLMDDDDVETNPLPVPDYVGGVGTLTAGVDYFIVTGLGLGSTPAGVMVSVSKPLSTDANIFATLRLDSLTADGFTVDLSAAPPGAGYKLNYLVMG